MRSDARTIARLASAHGRVLGADAAEIAAAEAIVQRVLKHPVLQAAARAARDGRCYREMPVTWRSDAGALIEGFVDLAYADEAGFVVVDFKTDRELEGAVERYQRQVSDLCGGDRRGDRATGARRADARVGAFRSTDKRAPAQRIWTTRYKVVGCRDYGGDWPKNLRWPADCY